VLEPADVQAIASEINEELGPGSGLAVQSVLRHANSNANGSAQESPMARSEERLSQTRFYMHLEQIEDRIGRLEKTVADAVDLLTRSVKPEPGTVKTKSSKERS